MSFINLGSSNGQERFSLSFKPYDPYHKQSKRKRKAKSEVDQPKSSEKKSTQNGAGAKSTSIPPGHEPADDDVTEIDQKAFYRNESGQEDRDKASNILENQSLTGVEGTNAFAADMTSKDRTSTNEGFMTSCQPPDDGDGQQTTLDLSMTTSTSVTSTNAAFDYDIGMPTPSSCNSVATSAVLKVGEQPCSSNIIPICSAQIPDTGELSNQQPVDLSTSGFLHNHEDKDITSNTTTPFDVDNRDGDAANSGNSSEELSQPKARLTSPSNSVNQDVIPEPTVTGHDKIHNSIEAAGNPRRNSEPLSDDEGDRHEVEKIVDHRENGGSREYLVIWAGWPKSSSTWEPARNLKGCPELVQEYFKSLKNCNSTSDATDTRNLSSPSSGEMSESDGDRYEIRKIVGHVEHNGWLRYEVEWAGGERTCEPAGNLDQCRETIETYWKELRSTKNATSTGDRSHPSNDQLQDRETSAANVAGQHSLGSRSSLEPQEAQREILDTAASRRKPCKRKREQDGSANKAHSKEGRSKKRYCGDCGETGHNKRTCRNDAVSVKD